MKAQVMAADVVQQVHGTVQEMLASFAIKPQMILIRYGRDGRVHPYIHGLDGGPGLWG